MNMQALEKLLSKIAGTPVEITIRGERSFTWSTEQMDPAAADKLAAFARRDARTSVSVEHDEECGSFVFLEVSA